MASVPRGDKSKDVKRDSAAKSESTPARLPNSARNGGSGHPSLALRGLLDGIWQRDRERIIVGSLVALIVAVRIALASVDRVVWGDEPFYLWLGRNWLTGRGYSFTGYPDVHHTPMYPLLTGALYLVVGDLDLSSRIWYVVFGALLAAPVYLIARRVYGRRVGYVALLLLSVWPALTAAVLRWGTLTEPPYYFFLCSALYLLLVALEESRWWCYGLAGVCLSFAYLTRPEAIGHLLILAGAVGLIRLLQRQLLRPATLLGLGALILGFGLFFAPYAWYTKVHTGSWMASEKAGVTFVTCIGLSEGDTAAFDRATWGLDSTGLEVFFFSRESYNVSMLDYILAYPRVFGELVYRNCWRFVSDLSSIRLFPFFLAPVVALGLFREPWKRRRTANEILFLSWTMPVLGFLLFFIQDRYIATILPLLLIWTAHGLWELGLWLSETIRNLWQRDVLPTDLAAALRAVPTVLLVVAFVVQLPNTLHTTSSGSYRMAHKTVGLWLEPRVERDTIIMSRYPAIAFHADARWVPTPNAEMDEVWRYAQDKGADYLVVDEREVRAMRPQFGGFLTESTLPAGFAWVHAVESQGERLVVLRVAGLQSALHSHTDGAHETAPA